MAGDMIAATAHRAVVERIRSRVAAAILRESERDVDVAHDRLDLRLRAVVMTILDEEAAAAEEHVRFAHRVADIRKAMQS